MIRLTSAIVGVVGIAWYSLLYYYFYLLLFIDVQLESIINPCLAEYQHSTCKQLTWVLLWFMELPVAVGLLFSYIVPASFILQLYFKKELKINYLLAGYVSTLLLVVQFTGYKEPVGLFSWYTLNTVITQSAILILGLKLVNHLTSKGTGSPNGSPVL